MHLHHRLARIDDWRPLDRVHHGPLLAEEHLLAIQIRHSPRQHRGNLKLVRSPLRPGEFRDHVRKERQITLL